MQDLVLYHYFLIPSPLPLCITHTLVFLYMIIICYDNMGKGHLFSDYRWICLVITDEVEFCWGGQSN